MAFSNNEFRWSPRIRREDGVLRMVAGLGTRAVDRVGNDYPLLVSPGQPGIRVNVMPEEVVHYSQKAIDVINMETRRFETHPIDDILREVGRRFPALGPDPLGLGRRQRSARPSRALDHPDGEDLIVDVRRPAHRDTGSSSRCGKSCGVLRDTFGMPMDVEFAHDGKNLYILQCRPQSFREDEEPAMVPNWIPEKRKLFSANRYLTNGARPGHPDRSFTSIPRATRRWPPSRTWSPSATPSAG